MNWYAFQTKPRNEKKVAKSLEMKGFEVFLPLQKLVRQWSDRKKKIQDPLFKSYIFIHVDEEDRQRAVATYGVVRCLYWLGKPAIVREEEIVAIRQFIGELDYVAEEAIERLEPGDLITITSGYFKGTTGQYLTYQGNQVILNIESLGQLIRVTLPAQQIVA
jgi:transcriptional antiterminator RfaH